MADNTFNFDLDAPAVPTLTLDPAPAAEEKAAPVQQEAPAPEAQVNLTPEEQAMVDQFAEKIDITNSQQVLQYGSACQKKIGDFSEAALSKVSTKDLGEVGDMITSLIGELKSFDAGATGRSEVSSRCRAYSSRRWVRYSMGDRPRTRRKQLRQVFRLTLAAWATWSRVSFSRKWVWRKAIICLARTWSVRWAAVRSWRGSC